MQVIVLAAGKGERLLPLTRNTPKCLLEIANGYTVLELQIEAIKQAGVVTEVILVVGYLADQVEAKIRFYETGSLSLKTIYNPFYENSNNLISLWLGTLLVGDRFIVMNGDNILDSSVIHQLLEFSTGNGEDDIVMVIDRKEKYDVDDMKVVTSETQVWEVAKEIDLSKANGESIGMIRFQGIGARRLKEMLDEIVRQRWGTDVFWLRAIQEIINDGFPVHYLECSPDSWAEIDFHPDLEAVRQRINRYADRIGAWFGESARID